MLPAQVGACVLAGVGQDPGDVLQREAECPVVQDLLQPLEIRQRVDAVPGGVPPARREQADLVIVVQQSHRDAGQLGHGAHRVRVVVHVDHCAA